MQVKILVRFCENHFQIFNLIKYKFNYYWCGETLIYSPNHPLHLNGDDFSEFFNIFDIADMKKIFLDDDLSYLEFSEDHLKHNEYCSLYLK